MPFRVIVGFTLLQLVWTGAVYGLTWAGVVGILFPVPIMLLVPMRQYLLPRAIRPEHLAELDAQTDELAEALEHQRALEEAVLVGLEPAVPEEQPSSAEEWELELHGSAHLRAVRHVSQETLRRRRQSLEQAAEAEPPSAVPGSQRNDEPTTRHTDAADGV